MNQSIKNPTVKFQADFESGNLDTAVRVSQHEYDIFLRVDSNTNGHCFWYYFQVTNNLPAKAVIKLNLCNLSRANTLYARGMRPYILRAGIWSQAHSHVLEYSRQPLRYDFIYDKLHSTRPYTQLSFQCQFEESQTLRFAYSPPYTYSQLLTHIRSLVEPFEQFTLGKSSGGVALPGLRVGSGSRAVVITGRVHPGETNSSYVLQGILRQIQEQYSTELSKLCSTCTVFIIPMLNPDGVILGNFRTGVRGRDLNRRFKEQVKEQEPQLVMKLVQHEIRERGLQLCLYIDCHGHSQKKNVFVYGPEYELKDEQFVLSRLFAKIVASKSPSFRYHSCSFRLQQTKLTTARAFFWQHIKFPYVYTLEASVGSYYLEEGHKNFDFTSQEYVRVGQHIIHSIQEFTLFLANLDSGRKKKANIRHMKRIKCDQNKELRISLLKTDLPPQIVQGLDSYTEADKLRRTILEESDSDAEDEWQVPPVNSLHPTREGTRSTVFRRKATLNNINLHEKGIKASRRQIPTKPLETPFVSIDSTSTRNERLQISLEMSMVEREAHRIAARRLHQSFKRKLESQSSRYNNLQGVPLSSCYYQLIYNEVPALSLQHDASKHIKAQPHQKQQQQSLDRNERKRNKSRPSSLRKGNLQKPLKNTSPVVCLQIL